MDWVVDLGGSDTAGCPGKIGGSVGLVCAGCAEDGAGALLDASGNRVALIEVGNVVGFGFSPSRSDDTFGVG